MAQYDAVARCQVGVSNVLGLHLRAADKVVKLASTFQSEIRVQCKGVIANARSILDLLSLAAECGTMLALEAQGCDAENAVAALADLISAQAQDSHDEGKAPSAPQPTPAPETNSSPASADRSGTRLSRKVDPRWESSRRLPTSRPGLEGRGVKQGQRNRW